MRTTHILLCATVALLFTSAVAQDSSGAPPPPLPPTSAPTPSPPPPPSTVVTTPLSITTAVTTDPGGSTVDPTITPGSNSTPPPAGPPSANTTTMTSTITSDNTTLPSTAITSDNTTLSITTIISDNTTLPTTTIISDNGTSAAVTRSQSTPDILTVPLPQPTITVATTQAILPIPTASVAQLPDKRTVNSTEPRIRYQGTSWTQTKSTCDSEVTSMKCEDPHSYLSYRFKALEGGSVFLGSTRSPDAGVYVVTLDNVQTKLDGFATEADSSCSFTWSQTNLGAGFHNLTVSFVGPSPQSSSQSGSFELNTFQLVAEDNSPSVPPASGGRSLLAEISRAAVFFAVLLHILSA